MTENRRESMTPVGIVGTPKTVAPQRLAITNENHRKRPAAKAGVAGSNPAGGTSVLAVQRPFFEIARGLWLPNDYIDPQGQPTASDGIHDRATLPGTPAATPGEWPVCQPRAGGVSPPLWRRFRASLRRRTFAGSSFARFPTKKGLARMQSRSRRPGLPESARRHIGLGSRGLLQRRAQLGCQLAAGLGSVNRVPGGLDSLLGPAFQGDVGGHVPPLCGELRHNSTPRRTPPTSAHRRIVATCRSVGSGAPERTWVRADPAGSRAWTPAGTGHTRYGCVGRRRGSTSAWSGRGCATRVGWPSARTGWWTPTAGGLSPAIFAPDTAGRLMRLKRSWTGGADERRTDPTNGGDFERERRPVGVGQVPTHPRAAPPLERTTRGPPVPRTRSRPHQPELSPP